MKLKLLAMFLAGALVATAVNIFYEPIYMESSKKILAPKYRINEMCQNACEDFVVNNLYCTNVPASVPSDVL